MTAGPRAPYVSGHCATGHHDQCRWTVANGDGSILACNHPYHQDHPPRCRLCGQVEQVGGPDSALYGVCLDVDACNDYRAAQREKSGVLKNIRAAQAHARGQKPPASASAGEVDGSSEERRPVLTARPAKAPKPCTCGCGGTTKGGNYLTGHDARHVSAVRKALSEIAPDHADVEVLLRALPSEALRAKALKGTH